MKTHRTYHTLAALICCILLLTVGCLPIFASTPYLGQNQEAVREFSGKFSELDTSYAKKDAPSNTPADKVFAVTAPYHSQVVTFVSDHAEEARTEDLRPAIALLYEKGKLCAALTWIAYRHDVIAQESAADTVYNQYEILCATVANASDATTLAGYADNLCITMNQAVFKQKINLLPQALNIEEGYVLDHLRQARAEIDTVLSPDIDGEEYLTVYERTRDAIILEQNRLQAKQEFSAVYDLLGLPSADKLNLLGSLSTSLAAATTTEDVNRTLLAATRACLQTALPGDGPYTVAYRQSLTSAMERAVLRIGNDAVVRLCPFLDGSDEAFSAKPFTLRAQIASAKDAVDALRQSGDDGALCNLLNTYLESGGILDTCDSRAALDYEVMRATYRVDWARKKPLYLAEIERILPTSSANALHIQARSIYEAVDEALCELPCLSDRAALDALVHDGNLQMQDLLCEAEAERFRITHADVLGESEPQNVAPAQLDAAIDAFGTLSAQTRQKLFVEACKLNDHYKAQRAAILAQYLAEDTCKPLREQAFGELNRLLLDMSSAKWHPSDLRRAAREIQARAEAIDTLLDDYAFLCAAPNYARYDSDSVTLLQEIVNTDMARLLDPEQTSLGNDADENAVPRVLQTTRLSLMRRAAIAEIRLAANGSELENVNDLLNSCSEAILSESDRTTIEALRDRAIFRIGAYRKADQMREELNLLEEKISSLRALNEDEKHAILSSDQMLTLHSACREAENAADADALTAIAASFATGQQALLAEAEKQALAAGVRLGLEEIEREALAIRERIAAFQYLSEEARLSYSQRLDTLVLRGKAALEAPDMTWEILDEQQLSIREALAGLDASALAAEEDAARFAILALWQEQYGRAQHYSESNYESILSLLSEGERLLAHATSMEAIQTVHATISAKLAEISNILDDAKKEAVSTLESTYEIVSKNKICYTSESWQEIEDIYCNYLDIINSCSAFDEVDNVLNFAKEGSQKIQVIRLYHLYSDTGAVKGNGTLASSYPDGYHPEESGYWAVLWSTEGIPHGSQFSVTALRSPEKIATLSSALESGSVVDAGGNRLENRTLSSLRNGVIANGIALVYTASSSEEGIYRISLLLPEGYDVNGILGVLFLDDDDSVEFYNCEIKESIMTFEASRISDFYIVLNKTINLAPLIIILALILLCEILAILLLIARRKAKEAQPVLPAVIPIAPFALRARITPHGGVAAVIILGICILVATLVLIWMILEEYKRPFPEQPKTALTVSKQEKERVVLPSYPLEVDHMPSATLPALYEPLPTVTAEMANAMMSDEEVRRTKERSPKRESAEAHSPLPKKVAVNIDVISENFEAYDTVSLATLKKRGLVPKNALAIKILARGTLDKPLTVVANDFSATAIKMILLTGGEVITAE